MLNEFYTFLKQRHYCHCFKENFCEMRKSIKSIGGHVHTFVEGTFTIAHTKADRLFRILPNQFLLILSVCSYLQRFPTIAQHLTYPLPQYKAPPLSFFQTCPRKQDRRAPMQQSMQDFLSTLPSQRGNVCSLQPEKKARFSNKPTCTFLGNHHSQTHRTA